MKKILLAMVLGLGISHALGVDIRYTVVDLGGGNPEWGWGGAGALNNLGHVTGVYSKPGETQVRLFRYTDEGGFEDLGGSLAGGLVLGYGINDLGQIAGYRSDPQPDGHRPRQAFRYADGQGFLPLGSLGGESAAYGINQLGQVTGYSELAPNGPVHAFRYTDGLGMQDLGSLHGGESVGRAINDQGWVTGNSDGWNVFLYRDDLGMVALGPGMGRAINNQGVVAGLTFFGPNPGMAAIWREGQMELLWSLGGGRSEAYGINERNQVVGESVAADGGTSAFLWTEAEGMLDLNALIDPVSGWRLWLATDINDAGQIVGQGFFDGKDRAFRLDIIPEPSTWALLALGAALLWLWQRGWGKRCA